MDQQEKAYKEALIETFRAFVNFCEAEHLSYFAAYGTALGAVRHKNIIPWDDDIDVYMPRADYDRLLSMQCPAGFQVMSMQQPGYWAPFAKWVNANTTLWEEKTQPVVLGIYVDIFVLDEAGADAEEKVLMVNKAARQFRRSNTHWTWSDVLDKLIHFHPLGFRRLLLDKIWYSQMRSHYRRQLQQAQQQVQQGSGPYLVSYNGPYLQREINQKEWFESAVRMPFADFEVNVPQGYDSYLHHLYGNYMQFPPEDKRQSTHSHFYLNLEKGMTLEQVCQELRIK